MNNESTRLNKWDKYFYGVCVAVSKNSSCLSRKIGAILVNENLVIATSYNGPPTGIPHCDTYSRREWLYENKKHIGFKKEWISEHLDICPRKLIGYGTGEGIDVCIAAHAERNLLNQCARLGISTAGTSLYMNAEVTPCKECFLELIQARIKEVICYKTIQYNDIKWLISNSNITIREFYL